MSRRLFRNEIASLTKWLDAVENSVMSAVQSGTIAIAHYGKKNVCTGWPTELFATKSLPMQVKSSVLVPWSERYASSIDMKSWDVIIQIEGNGGTARILVANARCATRSCLSTFLNAPHAECSHVIDVYETGSDEVFG